MSARRSRSNARSKIHTRSYTGPRVQQGVFLARQLGAVDDFRPANSDDNVAPLALAHGRYETIGEIIRPDIFTKPEPRTVNRSVTVIDDWINGEAFIRPQVRVIEYVRDLWRDIRPPRHPYFDPPDLEDRQDSFDSERAKNLLRRCKNLVGTLRWSIFENVIRWNEPTGISGSRMASVSEASIAAAQQIVRDVANEIRSIL